MKDDINSLSHSKWRCKYHIVFAPKYRRMAIYGDIRKDIGVILRTLCEHKKVEIIEAELCRDHIHMLVSIPPNLSVSQFVGYLKGKSSLMIFDRHANLKYKYGNRHFWCRGYYVDKTYLQSQYSVETWAFLNQLSLMLVYKIYNKLHEKDLTKKYSVADFLDYLKYIRKVKINNVWYTGEITKASQTLLDKLDIDIT